MNTVPIIDSHIHLWDINKLKYPWLENVSDIQRSFFIEDYQEATDNHNIQKIVVVQADCPPEQTLEELQFIEEQQKNDQRIQAFIAYLPLENKQETDATLSYYSQHKIVKGVRKMFDQEPEIAKTENFINNAKMLAKYGLTLDLCLVPASVPYVFDLLDSCPEITIIIDHLAKPAIAELGFEEFVKNMDALSSYPNVVAKLSGLLTEAKWHQWKVSDLKPYINYALQVFGSDRIVFGSDWPVLTLAGDFDQWLTSLSDIFKDMSEKDKMKIFYTNALSVYNL